MALSQKHRSVLFDYLAPRVGEEVTEALMAEFPARDGDELVTKEFLRAELAEVRSEFAGLRGEFGELRGEFGELRGEFGGLRGEFGELRGEFADLRSDVASLRSDLMIRLTGLIGVATAIIVAAR